jgi:hypothetical protein
MKATSDLDRSIDCSDCSVARPVHLTFRYGLILFTPSRYHSDRPCMHEYASLFYPGKPIAGALEKLGGE